MTEVKIEVPMPKQCTTAKPRTGPEPKIKSAKPAIKPAARSPESWQKVFTALTDSGLRLSSDAQFFTNTFVNQHIRVNGHTERKRDSRNTRQRERCLQHRQNRNQHHDVADQRYGTHHTEDLIVKRHENSNHNEAVKR